MKKFNAFLLLLMLLFPLSARATVWPISGTATPDPIGSDYGPRNVSNGSSFHHGLDFFVYMVPVKSITATTIISVVLAPGGTAGNYVTTANGFGYLHLSQKTAGYEIREGFNKDGEFLANYIVFKDASGKTVKVLSISTVTQNPDNEDDRFWYDHDNDQNTENVKEPIASKSSLAEGEIFAYSGNSGLSRKKKPYGYHLHIDKGPKGPNPLRDLPYTPVPSRVQILQPTGGAFPAGEMLVMASVQSGPDYDLNEVKMTAHDVDMSYFARYNPIFDRPTEPNKEGGEPYINKIPYGTGMYPKENGYDVFVLKADPTDKCYSSSTSVVKVEAKDLNGSGIETFSHFDVLPNPNKPGCSRPDDTFSVNDGFNFEAFIEPDDADEVVHRTPFVSRVGMIKQGYYSPWRYLLWRWKDVPEELAADFSPAIVKKHPLLILPSGGLYGMENSEFFKAALAEYVKNGGTVLAFAQQRGSEYSALPTPDGKPVTAAGWSEDISCWFQSSYIDMRPEMEFLSRGPAKA